MCESYGLTLTKKEKELLYFIVNAGPVSDSLITDRDSLKFLDDNGLLVKSHQIADNITRYNASFKGCSLYLFLMRFYNDICC